MGYDLHITRAEDWSESEKNPIAWDEWCDLVDADPELSFSKKDRISFSNQLSDQPLVEWNGSANEGGVFYWYDGRIVANRPDEILISKMVAIGHALEATVQGDEGEPYPRPNVPLPEKRSNWLPVFLIGIVVAACVVAALLWAD